MKLVLCLAGIVLWSSGLSAAVIKGVVSDTLTQAKVESVLVTVKGTANKAYTNASGVFTLNTASAIQLPGAAIDRENLLANARATVYGPGGTALGSGNAADLSRLLSSLPDGMYLIVVNKDDRSFTGKAVKLQGLCRLGEVTEGVAKTAATVTLVYTHKYYNTKEAAAAEGDTNVVSRLRMWWPDATNTGVPAGTVLTSRPSSRYIISQNGAVVEGLDIVDCVEVNANNVTIRKCRIHVDTWYLIKYNVYSEGYTNLLVEDCELDGTNGANTMVAIAAANYTLRRCNIHGSGDGPRIWAPGNALIEDCYVHDLWNPGGAHNDAVDLSDGANAVVRHNTIYNQEGQTSCITAGADNTLIQYNLMAGGGYTIYGGGTNVRIINNVFSKKYFPNCGSYGVRAYWSDTGNQWSGNVWYENGQTCQ
jgi:hypothetical protein